MAFIREHPARFLRLSATGARYFWSGGPERGNPTIIRVRNLISLSFSLLTLGGLWVTLKRRRLEAFLFASLLAVYPLVYYITFAILRYPHPIEPERMTLCICLFTEARISGKNELTGTTRQRQQTSGISRPSRTGALSMDECSSAKISKPMKPWSAWVRDQCIRLMLKSLRN